ncbi:hypothetical protein DMA11_10000 [Marinilabiliaceae bacterium JC017]|nr:hypothetical protein DMA11_10000 [Marinilabiliaceae bacterium JC017]
MVKVIRGGSANCCAKRIRRFAGLQIAAQSISGVLQVCKLLRKAYPAFCKFVNCRAKRIRRFASLQIAAQSISVVLQVCKLLRKAYPAFCRFVNCCAKHIRQFASLQITAQSVSVGYVQYSVSWAFYLLIFF